MLLAVLVVAAVVDLQVLDLAWNRQLLFAILVMQPFVLLIAALGALRFALLSRNPRLPVWPCFKALQLANGLNALLPSHLGELVKPTYLRDHQGVPLSEGLAAVFIERATDVLVLAILALIGASLLVAQPNTAFLLAGAVVVAVFVLLPRTVEFASAATRLVPWKQLRMFADRLLRNVAHKANSRSTYLALGIGIAVWTVSWASVAVFISVAGGRPLEFTGGLLVLLAVTVGGSVPALPGGFGTYEAAAVLALRGLGYGFEEALVIAVALHLSQILINAGGAAVILAFERIGLGSLVRDLRALAEGRAAR